MRSSPSNTTMGWKPHPSRWALNSRSCWPPCTASEVSRCPANRWFDVQNDAARHLAEALAIGVDHRAPCATGRAHPRAATPEQRAAFKGGLDAAVAQARAAHPDEPVEVWAEDGHRLGLKPIRRRAINPLRGIDPIGDRPIVLGHHRHKWLHATASAKSGGCARLQPRSDEAV